MNDSLFLAAALARQINDERFPPPRTIAVGTTSPWPAAACLMLKALGANFHLFLLEAQGAEGFSAGTGELFDLAAQGRIDLFFLSGGEIDGEANINLIGIGVWPGETVRFPGSFGSPFLYLLCPRTILFREEHSKRVFPPRVAHISAPGHTPPGVFRRGTASALLTGRAAFCFDAGRRRFSLASLHPGQSRETVREATGFVYDEPDHILPTPEPTPAERAALQGPVAERLAAIYPAFAARLAA